MTRYGIGPTFFTAAALYGLPAGWLSFRYPDVFSIQCIPYYSVAICGTGLLIAGIAIYIKALRTFNAGYRRGMLVTEGAFSVVRHPIYAAWILLIIPGLVLFSQSWLMLAVPLVAYADFKAFIHREDEDLESRFGKEYVAYRSAINELFPLP